MDSARYNTFNTIGSGMELDEQATNGALPTGGNHYSIHDLVMDNINYPTCYGCSDGATVTLYNDLLVTPSQALNTITVNHVTFVDQQRNADLGRRHEQQFQWDRELRQQAVRRRGHD